MEQLKLAELKREAKLEEIKERQRMKEERARRAREKVYFNSSLNHKLKNIVIFITSIKWVIVKECQHLTHYTILKVEETVKKLSLLLKLFWWA